MLGRSRGLRELAELVPKHSSKAEVLTAQAEVSLNIEALKSGDGVAGKV